MTLRFLLDTNVISEPLRPTPNLRLLDALRRHQSEAAIPAVAWHELWFGCRRLPASAKRSAIEAYLTGVVAGAFPILPYDDRAADWHAAERARLAQAGQTPPFADGQIAAIAHTQELTLVTLNGLDYAGFQGLQLADWR